MNTAAAAVAAALVMGVSALPMLRAVIRYGDLPVLLKIHRVQSVGDEHQTVNLSHIGTRLLMGGKESSCRFPYRSGKLRIHHRERSVHCFPAIGNESSAPIRAALR